MTKMLARQYGYRPIYESTESNPYINSFYEDMRRWSFNIQIYYLHTRTRQLLDIHKESKNIIQDRTLYEDAYIFTPNLHAMGLMNTRDFENYQHTFELVSSFLQPPDLLIYLRADVPTLIRNIQARGATIEDYLKQVKQTKEQWEKEINAAAENRIIGHLIVAKLGEELKVTVTEEEIDDQLDSLRDMYKRDEHAMKELSGEEARISIRNRIRINKTMDALVALNIEHAPKAAAKKPAAKK